MRTPSAAALLLALAAAADASLLRAAGIDMDYLTARGPENKPDAAGAHTETQPEALTFTSILHDLPKEEEEKKTVPLQTKSAEMPCAECDSFVQHAAEGSCSGNARCADLVAITGSGSLRAMARETPGKLCRDMGVCARRARGMTKVDVEEGGKYADPLSAEQRAAVVRKKEELAQAMELIRSTLVSTAEELEGKTGVHTKQSGGGGGAGLLDKAAIPVTGLDQLAELAKDQYGGASGIAVLRSAAAEDMIGAMAGPPDSAFNTLAEQNALDEPACTDPDDFDCNTQNLNSAEISAQS